MDIQKSVIIVAGGKGLRMQSELPKQFIELAGKPVLMHTMEQFHSYDHQLLIILVLPGDQIEFWKELCKKHDFKLKHQITAGGEERFLSVKNGLELTAGGGLVAVHDGVRPLVSHATIDRCFAEAGKSGAAIPVVKLTDSIREISGTQSRAVNRESYRLVQTPQVFRSDLLKDAYKQDFDKHFTDDASVVEAFGTEIKLVDGNVENIKITTAPDLYYATMVLNTN